LDLISSLPLDDKGDGYLLLSMETPNERSKSEWNTACSQAAG
jgi:hypothetical protein